MVIIKKSKPTRSLSHETDDIGTAIFHYAISKHMVTRSILKNDYGIDEIIDVVDISFLNNVTGIKILPGQIFAVQLKSSKRNSNSQSLKYPTLSYLFNLNIPTFLVKVNTKEKTYKFANIKKQIRENFSRYENKENFSLKLKSTYRLGIKDNILKKLEKDYLSKNHNSLNELTSIELNHLLSNISLLMEFNDELQREELELNIMLFLNSFKSNIDFLYKSLSQTNDSGWFNERLSTKLELIIILTSKGLSIDFNPYRAQNNSSKESLIYQDIANMYVALKSVESLLNKEEGYWSYKFGYKLNDIMPKDLFNFWNKKFNSLDEIIDKGQVVLLNQLIKEAK